MFKKILVPLDGSSLAEYALGPAITLARPADEERTAGQLVLLSVPVYDSALLPLPVGNAMYWSEDPHSLEHNQIARRQAESYLRSIRISHESPRLAVINKVVDGDVAAVILDTAEDDDIDLIVMSTHGRSGFSRLMMGSITERVLHHAPCPVMTIRNDMPIRHMLITLDGSPLAEKVLEPALAVAEKLGCEITLLHVEHPVVYSPEFVKELERAEQGLGEQYVQDIFAQPNFYLELMLDRLRPRGLPIQGRVASGPVAQTIMRFAEYHNVDLIAMCTHGRTGLRRWVYGSVTEKTMRSVPCNMLIVRPWH
jgi:nucleotide-binding universal stress UspA family protein